MKKHTQIYRLSNRFLTFSNAPLAGLVTVGLTHIISRRRSAVFRSGDHHSEAAFSLSSKGGEQV